MKLVSSIQDEKAFHFIKQPYVGDVWCKKVNNLKNHFICNQNWSAFQIYNLN